MNALEKRIRFLEGTLQQYKQQYAALLGTLNQLVMYASVPPVLPREWISPCCQRSEGDLHRADCPQPNCIVTR